MAFSAVDAAPLKVRWLILKMHLNGKNVRERGGGCISILRVGFLLSTLPLPWPIRVLRNYNSYIFCATLFLSRVSTIFSIWRDSMLALKVNIL